MSQRSPDVRQATHNDDFELQRALEASELEAALAQSRQAAEEQLYTDRGPARPQLEPAASDDEELKAAMALSEAEAKQAAKGKGIMKRTPTEEDMERALQESAKLAKSSPTHTQHHHGSKAPYISHGGASSWQDQSADDEALARALQESAQLASSSQPPPTNARVAQHQSHNAGSPVPTISPYDAIPSISFSHTAQSTAIICFYSTQCYFCSVPVPASRSFTFIFIICCCPSAAHRQCTIPKHLSSKQQRLQQQQ